MATRSITVERTDAQDVGHLLRQRVRLTVTETRSWYFWRVFEVSGPTEVVAAAFAEVEEYLYEEWLSRVW